MTTLKRYRGCLLGLATGDALGTTLEFKSPGSFKPLRGIVGGGPFDLKPGEWTDDTSMMLCLAESLVHERRFNPVHQLQTYTRWRNHGHLSVKGRCFDIGYTTAAALNRFEKTGNPYCGDASPHAAGNGSLMRLAPVPLAFAASPDEAVFYAGESSRTTHAAPECIDACRYFARLLLAAVNGATKSDLLDVKHDATTARVRAIVEGIYLQHQPPAIRGSGYVIHTLEAALWAFYSTDTFRAGALKVVNLGEDADSTGAVYGQIAGAFYGVDGIPDNWRKVIAMRPLIERRAGELLEMSRTLRRTM